MDELRSSDEGSSYQQILNNLEEYDAIFTFYMEEFFSDNFDNVQQYETDKATYNNYADEVLQTYYKDIIVSKMIDNIEKTLILTEKQKGGIYMDGISEGETYMSSDDDVNLYEYMFN